MGQRNPDRVSIRQRYARARDVAEMAKAGWDVISVCRQCGLQMQVDLKLIAYVSGPRTSLWNRYARCRRLLCGGVVEFHAKAPGMAWHERLAFDEKEVDRAPAWLRSQRKSPPA
jgi:hypothetical protein